MYKREGPALRGGIQRPQKRQRKHSDRDDAAGMDGRASASWWSLTGLIASLSPSKKSRDDEGKGNGDDEDDEMSSSNNTAVGYATLASTSTSTPRNGQIDNSGFVKKGAMFQTDVRQRLAYIHLHS
jgi:hypothetical protein